MRYKALLVIAVVVALSISQVSSQHSQSARSFPNVGFGPDRSIPLTIKVVFLGLNKSSVNSTYLTSNVNIPSLKYQTILAGPLNTGVVFNFSYQLVFADNPTVSKFASFLSAIGIEQDTSTAGGPASPYTLTNPYFSNSSSLVGTVRNYFYNASKVESWLASNMTLFGGIPIPGYTLFVADLHDFNIPSLTYLQYREYNTPCGTCSTKVTVQAHYYNRTVTDPDLGLLIRKPYMTGWGGDSRLSYLDLSAGPSYVTGELPIQVAAQLRGVNQASAYGRTWTTQFVADYLSGAIYNLFAADQLYPVNYSQKYSFRLFVIDNRTSLQKAQGPTMASTLDVKMIRSQLTSLLPFANVTVTVKFADITDYPRLAFVVANSTTSIVDPAIGHPIVDARPVWNWLSTSGQGHISGFINVTRTTQEIDIPAFIFAFNGTYNFGFTIKEGVFSREDPDSIFGVSLGDMVLISHGQSDLKAGDNATRYGQPGRGVGFTRTIIHELGHMIGLMHPFQYDQTEDFTDSVMAYYPDSSTYSQFDRDTILRGVNDELLIFAQQTLAGTPNSIFNSPSISQAQQNMAQANQHYNSMDYAGAVQYSLNAALDAAAAQQFANVGFLSPALVFGLIGVAVGAVGGLLVGYLFFRRRIRSGVQYNRCPTCQQPLRWDAVQMRWYCDRCQKPV